VDLIMGRFADATIDALNEAEVDMFERLSEAPDPDLYAWISGERAVPPEYDHELMRRLRTFHRLGAT
jgi:antitoxin CptB